MLSSKSATDATASMSSLLLQGWAMQAQSCFECKVPLMRKRGQDDSFCVNCKKTFDKDGKPKGGEKEAEASQAAKKSDTQWLSGMGGDAAHQQAPRAPAPAQQPDPSASRSPLDAFRAMRQQAGIPEAPISGPAAPNTEAEEKPDPSEELATKMLEGWALLGIHCPRCGQPLVRNKEGKMWCVGCSVWVLTQEQAEAAEAAKKKAIGGGPTPTPTPPPEAADKPQQQQQPVTVPVRQSQRQSQVPHGDVGSLRNKIVSEEGGMAASQPSNPQVEPAAAAPAGAAALMAPGSSMASAEAMSNAVSALTEKLNEAAQELKSIPVTHTSSCFQYVQLIRECSGALGELHELNAKHQRLG